jgi:hypothetical protein
LLVWLSGKRFHILHNIWGQFFCLNQEVVCKWQLYSLGCFLYQIHFTFKLPNKLGSFVILSYFLWTFEKRPNLCNELLVTPPMV